VLTRPQRVGAALEAHLSDGSVIPCDLVVSAIGLRPRTDLAAAAGLQVNVAWWSIASCAPPTPTFFALGDCAEVDGINLLYVMPLMTCARALAQTLAGNPTAVAYGPMPVTVKTPACPLVVSLTRRQEGTWQARQRRRPQSAVPRG
jgi:rubredoxin-NAD+ reductase